MRISAQLIAFELNQASYNKGTRLTHTMVKLLHYVEQMCVPNS
jgi:hypothetical protein